MDSSPISLPDRCGSSARLAVGTCCEAARLRLRLPPLALRGLELNVLRL